MNLSLFPSQSTSVFGTIVAGWRRLRTAVRPTTFGGRVTYAEDVSPTPRSALVLGVIDDPDRSMRLLSVRGGLTGDSIPALADAFAEVPNSATLHLDLTDVELAHGAVITRLGALLDALEDRNVRMRIVGLGRLATVRID